jgi:hypothetical protein
VGADHRDASARADAMCGEVGGDVGGQITPARLGRATERVFVLSKTLGKRVEEP